MAGQPQKEELCCKRLSSPPPVRPPAVRFPPFPLRRISRERFPAALVLLLSSIACGASSDADTATTPVSSGALALTVVTTGRDIDSTGYTVSVTGQLSLSVPANGTVAFRDISAGTYTVTLADIALNCTAVRSGFLITIIAAQTATDTARVRCAGPLRDRIVLLAREWEGALLPKYEVFAIRPDGSGLERITWDQADYREPVVSPDGLRIAVSRGYEGGKRFGLYVMDADGANARLLTGGLPSNVAVARDPAWSPDGSRLVFQGAFTGPIPGPNGSTGETAWNRVFVVNADGTGLRELAADTLTYWRDDWTPRWSPDGQRIVWVRYMNSTPNMVSAATDGRDIRPFNANQSVSPLYYAWSPDGTRMALSDNGRVWIAGADGTRRRAVSFPPMYTGDAMPSWSPDGRNLAFVRYNQQARTYTVVRVDTAGTKEAVVTTLGGIVYARWTPLP
jgi:dipeptidyl aminopeptidase/acylaminoacyl peptidase